MRSLVNILFDMTKRRSLGLNATTRASFKSQTQQRKSNGNKIRRMLAAMEAQGNQNPNQAGGHAHGQPDRNGSTTTATKVNPESEQFFSTGRTGRRNALPDILGDHAHVTSSDLPARLQALTTSETNKLNPEDQPGPSRHTPEQN